MVGEMLVTVTFVIQKGMKLEPLTLEEVLFQSLEARGVSYFQSRSE